MGVLKDRLQADLTQAMRAQDDVVRATLRLALTAIQNEEVSGTQARELADPEVEKVLTREVKRRKEAAQVYRDGGAGDRADRELAEAVVLEKYLPEQLTDEQLRELAASVIAEVGATEPNQLGAVMKALTPRVAGRADGGRVSAAVRQLLAG